jgi:hypothetical protein
MPEMSHKLILNAVEYITDGSQRTFTITELMAELRTHVGSRLCASLPTNHGTTHTDFDRIDRRDYRWRG